MSMNRFLNKYRELTDELMEGKETNVDVDISVAPSKFAELRSIESDMVANRGSQMEYLRYVEGGITLSIFSDIDVQEDGDGNEEGPLNETEETE